MRLAIFAALALLLAGTGVFSLARAQAQQEPPILGLVVVQGDCGGPAEVPVTEIALTGPIGQFNEEEQPIEYRGAVQPRVSLAYTDSTYSESTVNFDSVLENLHSLMVLTDSADPTSVVACGQIGGPVRDGEVPVALYPENDSGMNGIAFLRDEGGQLAVRAYIFTSMEMVEIASPIASPSPMPSPSPVASGGQQAAQTEFTVEMVDIAFNPTELRIPANTDVTITLPNNGVAVHNFNVDELGVSSGDVPGGQTGTVTINAEPGTYEYYCSVPGHREAGMIGTLIVE
jgi:plastocyanin